MMVSSQKQLKCNEQEGTTQAKADDLCQVRCFNTEQVQQIRAALPSKEILEAAQVLFTALADKSRLKILCALQDRQELCVCDIAALLGAQTAVASHHLRKLRDLKLLQHRNEGKLVYYSLKNPLLGEVLTYVIERLEN